MILLGVAPRAEMVFVGCQLVKGDANCTLVPESVNDLVMVSAFGPIAAFLLGVTDIAVPWQTPLLRPRGQLFAARARRPNRDGAPHRYRSGAGQSPSPHPLAGPPLPRRGGCLDSGDRPDAAQ